MQPCFVITLTIKKRWREISYPLTSYLSVFIRVLFIRVHPRSSASLLSLLIRVFPCSSASIRVPFIHIIPRFSAFIHVPFIRVHPRPSASHVSLLIRVFPCSSASHLSASHTPPPYFHKLIEGFLIKVLFSLYVTSKLPFPSP
jgi:hypothetical protein